MTNKLTVFLSYNSSDKHLVEGIAGRLKKETGLNIWLDNWNLVPGDPVQKALESALNKANIIIIFIGPSGMGDWQNVEMVNAFTRSVTKKNVRVIPVILPGGKKEETNFLSQLTWVEFTKLEDESAFQYLVSGIRRELPGQREAIGLWDENGVLQEDMEVTDMTKRKKDLKFLSSIDREKLKGAQGQEKEAINENIKNYLYELRHINESEIHKLKSGLEQIDFVNRWKEIQLIERSIGRNQYWLLEGPIGCGKTELLKKLWSGVRPDLTIGIFLQIEYNENLLAIYNKFRKILGLEDVVESIHLTENDFHTKLLDTLEEKHGEELTRKELSLFIDFDGKPSDYFSLFLEKVIPAFWDRASTIRHFESNPEGFKVFYASRYFSKMPFSMKFQGSVNSLALSDFNFESIYITVENRLNQYGGGGAIGLNEITAHVLFLTGGHPLCIAKALQTLGKRGPAHLVAERDKIYTLINLIAESIEFEFLSEDPWFFPVIQFCSLFTFITPDILKKLKSLFKNLEIPNDVHIEKRLKRSLLWKESGNDNIPLPEVLEDGISRRVLAINLRQTNPKAYKEYCEFAKKCCLDGITAVKMPYPRRWLIEYYFQSLQLHVEEIEDSHGRQKIKNAFYHSSGDFIEGVKAYKTTIPQNEDGRLEDEIDKILRMIDTTTEFRFVVNYYLRVNNTGYDDSPILDFKQRLKIELEKP